MYFAYTIYRDGTPPKEINNATPIPIEQFALYRYDHIFNYVESHFRPPGSIFRRVGVSVDELYLAYPSPDRPHGCRVITPGLPHSWFIPAADQQRIARQLPYARFKDFITAPLQHLFDNLLWPRG